MFLVILEISASIATVGLAFMWIRNLSGNYEPWTVICGVVVAGSEIYRRVRTRPKGETKQVSKPEELFHWIQDHSLEKPLS